MMESEGMEEKEGGLERKESDGNKKISVPLPDDVIVPGMSAEMERRVRRELRTRVAQLSAKEKEARRLERNRRSAERVKRGIEEETEKLLEEEAVLNSQIAQTRRENSHLVAYLSQLEETAGEMSSQLDSCVPVELIESSERANDSSAAGELTSTPSVDPIQTPSPSASKPLPKNS
mmetsp:Transcript_3427/g.7409  ORF Transcript_3427/g.7409 Transcript_3427/m.7409 type:complete len:176 (-) Transcript_3427:88-615(-)